MLHASLGCDRPLWLWPTATLCPPCLRVRLLMARSPELAHSLGPAYDQVLNLGCRTQDQADLAEDILFFPRWDLRPIIQPTLLSRGLSPWLAAKIDSYDPLIHHFCSDFALLRPARAGVWSGKGQGKGESEG